MAEQPQDLRNKPVRGDEHSDTADREISDLDVGDADPQGGASQVIRICANEEADPTA